MLELVNKTLYLRPIESQYVALAYSVYDPQTCHIALANSGLPYPLLIHCGQPKFLELAGIPLGLFPDSQYQETDLALEPGDVLVFYSDGVVESRNDAGEDFGLKRLAETVRANHETTADGIVQTVNAALEEFRGRIEPQDDRTMIVVKMLE
jgi:sigma-B regulation protein RsbU (phosphoserine phosphatase)